MFDILFDMEINVSELLRNFPKVRRAALAGQRVVIRTRDGDLVLMADKLPTNGLFGALASSIQSDALSPEDSGVEATDWSPAL